MRNLLALLIMSIVPLALIWLSYYMMEHKMEMNGLPAFGALILAGRGFDVYRKSNK